MVLGAEHITTLLQSARDGDREAAERLIEAVYTDLRKVARRYMAAERPGHTLQPTAVVHEVLLRMFQGAAGSGAWQPPAIDWQGRAHFLGVVAHQMRQVLIDHARRKRTAKRNFGIKISLKDMNAQPGDGTREFDFETLDQLLDLLETKDKAAAKVVELRFFGGLTDREAAEAMNTNLARVRRDWEFARSWLRRRLID